MKRILLPLLLLVFLMEPAISQTIPNRGFENWSQTPLFLTPDHWNTPVGNEFARGLPPSATRTTQRHGGAFALKLTTSLAPAGDTLTGYAINSGFINGGQSGLSYELGFPFNDTPDSLYVWSKPQLIPGDSAMVIVTFKLGGSVISENYFWIFGNLSNYTRFGFDIPTLATSPDTCIVAFAASNPGLPNPGNTIYLDDVSFTGATDSIPNAGFEYWSLVSVEDPDAWKTVNLFNVLEGTPPSCVKDTAHHSGNYSLRFETVQFNLFGGSKSGFITVGDFPGNNGLTGGIPFSGNLQKLSGWYKYSPVGNDTAGILLIMTHYVPAQDSTYVLGVNFLPLTAAANFTYFELTPTWNTGMPIDTVNLFIVASKELMGGNPANVNPGSRLWLDDLWLSNGCNYIDTLGPVITYDSLCDFWVLHSLQGFSSYTWTNGGTGVNDTTTTQGWNSVILTDNGGCTFRDSVFAEIYPCPGNTPEIETVAGKAWPNPSSGEFRYTWDGGEGWMEVTDLQGKTVLSAPVPLTGNGSLSLNGKPDGIYLLHIRNLHQTCSVRLMKN